MCVLGLFFWLTLSAAATKGPAYDEVPHLTAGYIHWAFDDYRFFAESGHLPQRWMAIPAALAGVPFPVPGGGAWFGANVWALGDTFFFGSGNSPESLLRNARLMVAILGALLGGLVFGWSSRLGPANAGLLSLLLFVLSPTILAHGALATSDMCAALFFLAATAALWSLLHAVTPLRILASVLAVGGLCLAKFSGLLILPIAGALLVIRVWVSRPWSVAVGRWTTEYTTRRAMAPAMAGLLLAHVIVVWLLVWAAFGFRYAATPPGSGQTQFLVGWEALSGRSSVVDAAVRSARDHHVLPEAYIYGFAHTMRNTADRNSFFNGEVGTAGWTGFFPYAFLAKSTPGFLLLLSLAGIGLLGVGPRPVSESGSGRLYDKAPLIAFIAVYGLSAFTSELNIGHRHLLPLYAPLCILAGGAAVWLTPRLSVAKVIVVGAFAWHAAESWLVRPHYLSYFNQFVGGPAQGYRHLVDSSLDWGQDLPALRTWLTTPGVRAPGDSVYLAYFGVDRPDRYGLDVVQLPGALSRSLPALRPGLYCVSATVLQAVYLPTPGVWSEEHETLYRELQHNVTVYDGTVSNPVARAQLEAQTGPDFWNATFAEFDRVRLARLVAYLRGRTPLATVANTILVYRLTPSDITAALSGPVDMLR